MLDVVAYNFRGHKVGRQEDRAVKAALFQFGGGGDVVLHVQFEADVFPPSEATEPAPALQDQAGAVVGSTEGGKGHCTQCFTGMKLMNRGLTQ